MAEIRIPKPLTKSMVKAMACETHFANYFLVDGAVVRRIGSPLAETGTDFHRYKAEYVNHLVETQQRSEPEWVQRWLDQNTITEDARLLIHRDVERFVIDPELVFGTEVFMSVDENFRPLALIPNFQPGALSDGPRVYASGTIDLLAIDGNEAVVTDYKSNWNPAKTSEYEAAHYAALVLAHFDFVEKVTFRWNFIRFGSDKPVDYTRADVSWIQEMIRGAQNRKEDIGRRFLAGEKLGVNPFSGQCVYCDLNCPLKQAVSEGVVDLPPIQTKDDAVAVAQRVFIADLYLKRTRDLLREYLTHAGKLDLGGGYVAEIGVQNQEEYPLDSTLRVLGFENIPESSPEWDVPLASLRIGATRLKSFAKAKKRAGLKEKLDEVKKVAPGSVLKIHRPESEIDEEQLSLLEGSVAS